MIRAKDIFFDGKDLHEAPKIKGIRMIWERKSGSISDLNGFESDLEMGSIFDKYRDPDSDPRNQL